MNLLRLSIALLFATLLGISTLPAPSAQEDGHPTGACTTNHVSHAGWDFCWQQDDPRAQGLELTQVYFKGQSVLWRIGVPFSLTKYDANVYGPYKDTLGSPGAGGHPGYGAGKLKLSSAVCPRFYTTGTLANNDYLCIETRGGPEPAVAIWAKYNIFNYRFVQGYRFDSRGHVEPFIRMGGNLIDGTGGSGELKANHFHHLLWRADFDIGAPGNDLFEVFRRAEVSVDPNLLQVPPASNPCVGPATSLAGWCPPVVEGRWLTDPAVAMKWRVADHVDLNSRGNPKGFEFRPMTDASADLFAIHDIMVVQYKGDSTQLGYEVPTNPHQGDVPLRQYYWPVAEAVTDPVVWIFQHIYHDTRDEDVPSMSYHESMAFMQPRNLHASNPGELSYP